MVENIVVIAIRRAAGAKESAIDHVVDEDPGGGQGVFLVWLTVAVFIVVEAAGTALPGDASRGGFHQALPFCVSPRRRGEGLGQPVDDIAAIFRRNDVDEVPPSRRKVQIGAGRRHGERVCREFGGIALEKIVDIRPAAQKDAAQDQGLHRCGMRDGVGQGEGAAPAAAKNVHLAVDVQLVAERRHVVAQMLVVLSVSAGVASSSLAMGVLLPQPRWSKSTTRYRCGLKKRADELWLPAPGPPCMTMTGSPVSEPYSSQ